jgi:hypothetical protein
VVTFLGGLAWGWQVHRDRIVAWTMVSHEALLMAMSFFTWD